MVQALDDAQLQSLDPPATSPPSLSYLKHTGGPSRPRIEIEPELLQSALALGPKSSLANMLGCSPRTITRRQRELEDAGMNLAPQQTRVTDDELDIIIREILHRFPDFGRSMVMGTLDDGNYNVPEHRVRASIQRVRGAPSQFFGARRIHRRKYFVPAVNSLWHHDGQHGKQDPSNLKKLPSLSARIDPMEDCYPWIY